MLESCRYRHVGFNHETACVSVLIQSGANIKQIQAWVGHSSITETMDTYGHLFSDSMLDLADKLDAYALQEADKLEKKTA